MYTMQIDDLDGGLAYGHANKHFLVKRLLNSVLGPQHTPNTNNAGVTGQPIIETFGVLVTPTPADAALLKKTLQGETINKITITLWTTNDGKTVMAQRYTLSECTIAQLGEGPEIDGSTRELRFNMVMLKLESFKPDGTATFSVEYDLRKKKVI